jgi:hypothetical protein
MNNSEKIKELIEKCGDSIKVFQKKKIFGVIPIFLSKKFLWIDEESDCWYVTLANGEKSHILFDQAIGAEFRKSDGLRNNSPESNYTGVWSSALTMHPVKDEKRAIEIFDLILERIEFAFQCYCASTLKKKGGVYGNKRRGYSITNEAA